VRIKKETNNKNNTFVFLLYNSVKDPVIIIIFIVIVIFNYRSCVFWAQIPRKPIQIGQQCSPTKYTNNLTSYKNNNNKKISELKKRD